jgi:hypothetical protein
VNSMLCFHVIPEISIQLLSGFILAGSAKCIKHSELANCGSTRLKALPRD